MLKSTGTCRVWGYPVAVEALRLNDGDLRVVIAPVGTQGLVPDYAWRWGIETLFGIFKTRGSVWNPRTSPMMSV